MTLCDAGPLFALVDKRQKEPNARCKAALPSLSLPLITTWPSFTEAMYLTGETGGWHLQRVLWQYVNEGVLRIHAALETEAIRMQELMQKYSDLPMDLADASLVAAAETLSVRRIFTLDSHFHAYRVSGTEAFEIVPAASR